jgi:hypothetical protein
MQGAWPLLVVGAFLLAFLAVLVLVAVVGVRTLGKVSRHGGVAGALYDGRVARTFGELDAVPRGIASVRVKVVGIERESPAVGIEIHVNAKLGYSMRAVRLTPEEALRMADALESAARR